MSLFDFLKRKKEVEKSKKPSEKFQSKPAKKAGEVKLEKKLKKEAKPEVETVAPKSAKPAKKAGSFFYEAVKQPHISEKATYLSEKNQYVFEVSPNFNKKEIGKAVEGIYGVDVLSVNIVKIPGKKRRLGKVQGYKKAYAKAVVNIKEGQKIEIL